MAKVKQTAPDTGGKWSEASVIPVKPGSMPHGYSGHKAWLDLT